LKWYCESAFAGRGKLGGSMFPDEQKNSYVHVQLVHLTSAEANEAEGKDQAGSHPIHGDSEERMERNFQSGRPVPVKHVVWILWCR